MIQGVRRPRVSIFLAPWLLLIVFQDPGVTAEHLRRGVELLEARAVAAAVVELEAAVALDPENVSARYHLGLAFFLTGELDAAVTQLKEALKGESDT
ncbi:MAG: tetratricopeptide repeat protein, partial [Vicinamibacterales bacterium]|nr:tetratricopeptide repeat protein [Vicinamibacterales bacterium]